jgi:hypothetical protein
MRKDGDRPGISQHMSACIRIEAETLAVARALMTGNPVLECGGSVDIRALRQS